METKHITTRATLKADDTTGALEAVFSTFGVVDSMGDIVERGAIPETQVPLVWAHDWTKPIGKGVVRNEPDRAVFSGQFFLDTTSGLDAYNTVKAMGDLQEYSWGLRVNDADYVERDGAQVRVIKRAEIFEVSPVLVGANRMTGTLSLKDAQSLTDHSDAALAAVADVVLRWRSLADLLLKDGRAISEARRTRMGGIADQLDAASTDLRAILKETETPPKGIDQDVLAAFMEAQRFLARQHGMTTI